MLVQLFDLRDVHLEPTDLVKIVAFNPELLERTIKLNTDLPQEQKDKSSEIP